jgi:hypothetical protein
LFFGERCHIEDGKRIQRINPDAWQSELTALPKSLTRENNTKPYYRAENDAEVFLFDGARLVYQPAMPRRAAVILVPGKLFDEIKARLTAERK